MIITYITSMNILQVMDWDEKKSLLHCWHISRLSLLKRDKTGWCRSDVPQEWLGLANVVDNVLQCPVLAEEGMGKGPGAIAHTPYLRAHSSGPQPQAEGVNHLLEVVSLFVDAGHFCWCECEWACTSILIACCEGNVAWTWAWYSPNKD